MFNHALVKESDADLILVPAMKDELLLATKVLRVRTQEHTDGDPLNAAPFSEVITRAPVTAPGPIPGVLHRGLTVLYARQKVGKTRFALNLMFSVAAGIPFLGYDTERWRGLYLDYENGDEVLAEAARQIIKSDEDLRAWFGGVLPVDRFAELG